MQRKMFDVTWSHDLSAGAVEGRHVELGFAEAKNFTSEFSLDEDYLHSLQSRRKTVKLSKHDFCFTFV
jgi:hypothetical protein